MVNFLVGSGHFSVGFIIGFLIMLVVLNKNSTHLNTQLYFPFFPFILGIWSSLPYLFLSDTTTNPGWFNIFLFFNLIHQNELIIKIFGKLNFVVIICGSIYTYILFHYIVLVKYCRRNGWINGV